MTLTIKILNLFMGAENRIHVILRSYPPFRKERWYAMLRIVGFFLLLHNPSIPSEISPLPCWNQYFTSSNQRLILGLRTEGTDFYSQKF